MADYDIVLLIGQSNNKSPGTQITGDDDYSGIPNTFQFRYTDEVVAAATHPLDAPGAGPSDLGKWKLFAENYEANHLEAGRSLLFVPAAFGGAGFENGSGSLYPDQSNYELAKDFILAALNLSGNHRIVFISFWHGERDAIAGSSTYYADLSAYWTAMKADISALNDSIPFALIQPAAREESGYANVLAGLKQFADENVNRAFIGMYGQSYDVSNHYDRTAVLYADQAEYDFYRWAATMSGTTTVRHKSIIGFNSDGIDASGNATNGQFEAFVGYNYLGELFSYDVDIVLINEDGATEDICVVGYGDRDLKNDVGYIVVDTDRSALIADNTTNDWPSSASLVFRVDGAVVNTLSAADIQAFTKGQLNTPTDRPNFVYFQTAAGDEIGCLTAMVTNGGGGIADSGSSGSQLVDAAANFVDDEHNGKILYNATKGCIGVITDTVASTNLVSVANMFLGSSQTNASGDVYRIGSQIEIELKWDGAAAASGGGGFEILDTLNNDAAFNAIFSRP